MDHSVQQRILKYREKLSEAARIGDVRKVSSLLGKKPDETDLNYLIPAELAAVSATPPLVEASYHGHLEVVKLLLKQKGIKVNNTSATQTPLSAAAQRGHVEIMKVLIDNGADVDYRGDSVNDPMYSSTLTALQTAVRFNNTEAAKFLLQSGASTTAGAKYFHLLSGAASKGNTELVQMLFDSGAELYSNKYPQPLTSACEGGHTECAQLLIQHCNADVNEENGAPLRAAILIKGNHKECVKVLLDNGADLENIYSYKGITSTPLMIASQHGDIDLVQLLLDRGANVNTSSPSGGETALFLASNAEVAKLLIEKGADINHVTDSGSILLDAVKKSVPSWPGKGYTDKAILLMEKGADVNLTDPQGSHRTPLEYVFMNNNFKVSNILEQLLTHGARVDVSSLSTVLQNDRSLSANIARKLFLSHATEEVLQDKTITTLISSMIVEAARYNDCKLAELLLQYGPKTDIAHKNIDALIQAVSNRHLDFVKLLLDHGVQVNSKNSNGDSALIVASQRGQTKCVEFLLERKAEIDLQMNLCNSSEESALLIATKCGHSEIVKLLLDHGALSDLQDSDGNTALMIAAEYGICEITKLLLDHGAHINLKNSNGNSALTVASQRGQTKCVEHLLKRKDIDLDLCNRSEKSPLMVAIRSGYSEIVKLLLDSGAFSDLQTSNGNTALMIATGCDNSEIVELLLNHGADPNLQDSNRNSALMIAANCGHSEIAKLLVDRGAQPDLQNTNGDTPLIVASERGDTHIVEQLLPRIDSEAVNHQNNKLCTALMLASERGNVTVTIVHKLLEHGAKLETLDIRGRSALFYAVKSNCPETVKVLLDQGADVGVKTIDEKSILQYAFMCHEEPDYRIIKMIQKARSTEIVGEFQFPDINKYLKKLNRSQIEELGAELGLNIFELEKMTNLPGDMVRAWLRKEGQVTERCGDPLTWRALVKALREIGQTGVADDIKRDKCYEQPSTNSPSTLEKRAHGGETPSAHNDNSPPAKKSRR